MNTTEQWYIREDKTLIAIPHTCVMISVTDPEFACMQTESGEQVGLKFTDNGINTQIRIVCSKANFLAMCLQMDGIRE